MLKYAVTRPVTNVVVFGCGGTGSRLIPLVTQLLSSHEFTKNVKVILVDGDIVEDKNTKRQLFTKMDVGKNKAEVLAKRYKIGFDAKTVAVPYFVPSVEVQVGINTTVMGGTRGRTSNTEVTEAADFYDEFLRAVSDPDQVRLLDDGSTRTWLSPNTRVAAAGRLFSNTTVFVSCVDSADARRRIIQFIHNLGIIGNSLTGDVSNSVMIDCGNEDLFGQVTYFNVAQMSLCPFPELLSQIPDKVPYAIRLPFVPMPLNFYLKLRDAETQRSCADMDQTLAINNTMANLAFSIFQNLVYGLEMDFHTIYANINGTYTTERLTMPWLKGVLSNNQNYLRGVLDGAGFEYEGKVPTLKEVGGAFPAGSMDGAKLAAESYFGFTPAVNIDSLRYPYPFYTKAGHQFCPGEATPSMATYSISNVYNNMSIKAMTPFSMFIQSNLFFSSWTEVVWPVIAKGLSTGFLQLNETLRKYAVVTSTLGLCKVPLMSPVVRSNSVNPQTFTHNFGLSSAPVDFSVLNNMVSFTFGDLTLSDERSKEQFVKNSVLSLNLVDSITGEDISVVLPSVNGELLAMCRVRVQQHRVDEMGVGRPSENRESTGVLSAIVCGAILSSMTKPEIETIMVSLSKESEANRRLMFKSVRNMMASARGYALGSEGISLRGELQTGDLVSWFMNPHEKYGKALMLFGEGDQGGRGENNMKVFGKTIAKSDICISTGARVYQEKELDKLVTEAAKGTILERVMAA